MSLGFRPFFLAGAVWAVVAVIVWLPQFFGELSLAGALQPMDWHAHETVFGYGGAVVTGFLLTAVPNWTGRPPLQGKPLAALVLLWLAGRAAVLLSAQLGWAVAALIDCAFLVTVCGVIGREIVAGNNNKNFKVLIFVGLLACANIAFHIEAHVSGDAAHGRRFGVAALVALVMLIGGRVIPSFTQTFLARRGQGRSPRAFSRFDALCLALSVPALAAWTLYPENQYVGLALIAAGLVNVARLARWAGERTGAEPLVAILHLAYAFIPLGFILTGLAACTGALPVSAGLHAWGVGAIGAMTLAVMTRASLGHTGRPLSAGRATQAIYAAVVLAALARIAAALAPAYAFALLHVAALCWLAAFGGFVLTYAGALLRPRS
nr:NnrS family protein [Rhodoblastus sphagnicola]